MLPFWELMGLIGGVTMPLWNIPLIIRIVKRRQSDDISLAWLFGVWGCMLIMLPSAVYSPSLTLKAFSICNAIFFSGVVAAVLWFRRNRCK